MITAAQTPYRDTPIARQRRLQQRLATTPQMRSPVRSRRPVWTVKVVQRRNNGSQEEGIPASFFEGIDKQGYLKVADPVSVPVAKQKSNFDAESRADKAHNSSRMSKRSSKTFTRFMLSRNVYRKEYHDNAEGTGILREHLETGKQNKSDSRTLLRGLSIKANTSLYKGNFASFRKKEVRPCTRSRRTKRGRRTDSDGELCPWQLTQPTQSPFRW